MKNEAIDRLSPLNSSTNTFVSFQDISDPENELEKFIDMDVDAQQPLVLTPNLSSSVTYNQLGTSIIGYVMRNYETKNKKICEKNN